MTYSVKKKKMWFFFFVCLFGLWFGGRVVFCFPWKSQIQSEKGKYFRQEKCSFLWSLPSAIKQWPEFQIAALIFFHIHVLKKKMDLLSHGWSGQESLTVLLFGSCNLDANSQVRKLEVYLLCQRRNQVMSNMPQAQPSNHHKDPALTSCFLCTLKRKKGWKRIRWVRWHHQLKGHEFEKIPGGSEGQGSLASCSPWSGKESNMT